MINLNIFLMHNNNPINCYTKVLETRIKSNSSHSKNAIQLKTNQKSIVTQCHNNDNIKIYYNSFKIISSKVNILKRWNSIFTANNSK